MTSTRSYLPSRAAFFYLGHQRVEQRLRILKIERVKTFREPAVHRSEQFARLLHFALVAPEAREAHGCAEFPRLCLLLTRGRDRTLEMRLHFSEIRTR